MENEYELGSSITQKRLNQEEVFDRLFIESEKMARPPSVTIGLPLEVVFGFFRDIENLPLFMSRLARVKLLSPTLSHWVFMADQIMHECDIEIFAERDCEVIAWRTIGETELDHVGVVTFTPAPGARGTVVRLSIDDERSEGRVSEVLAQVLGKTTRQSSTLALRRLKALLETGEIPTTQGQPNGKDQENKSHLQ